MIMTQSQCFVKHIVEFREDQVLVQSFPGWRIWIPAEKLKADGGPEEIQRNHQEFLENREEIELWRQRQMRPFKDDL